MPDLWAHVGGVWALDSAPYAPVMAVERAKPSDDVLQKITALRAEGKSQREITAATGVSYWHVNRTLKALGVSSRRAMRAPNYEAAREAYAAGAGFDETCRRFGLNALRFARELGSLHRRFRASLTAEEVEAVRHAASADGRLVGLVARLARGA